MLPGDASLSLRHLALLVHARSIRLLDLHTGTGLVDESGRRLSALTANGPA